MKQLSARSASAKRTTELSSVLFAVAENVRLQREGAKPSSALLEHLTFTRRGRSCKSFPWSSVRLSSATTKGAL